MPRLRERPDPDEAVREVIKVGMMRMGLTQADLGKKIDRGQSCVSQKIRKPQSITLVELRAIANALNLTDEALIYMIRGRKGA